MRLFSTITPALAGTTGAMILAQATVAGVDPSIATLIGNGATVAVLVWYVIYDVRVRTPMMLSTFAKEQAEIRKTFEDEQIESRKTHLAAIESLRQTFSQEQSTARQAFTIEQSAQREAYHREMVETRQMLFETMKAMRTAVHDVKDTAQSLMGDGAKRAP